jgi:eukaryotic-like serine/threonine-protein kinase
MTSDHGPVDRLAEEFLERRRRGECPAIAEYVERHPEWADEILEVFPALVMMEQLKPTPDDLTGSDSGASAGSAPAFERLGDYRILREVGRGGTGIVYEAVQESLGRHERKRGRSPQSRRRRGGSMRLSTIGSWLGS